jgi:hypothetical protein
MFKLSIHTLLESKKKGEIQASYVNASDLQIGDLICYPIPHQTNIVQYNNKNIVHNNITHNNKNIVQYNAE